MKKNVVFDSGFIYQTLVWRLGDTQEILGKLFNLLSLRFLPAKWDSGYFLDIFDRKGMDIAL